MLQIWCMRLTISPQPVLFFSPTWKLRIASSYFNLHFFNYDWDWISFQMIKKYFIFFWYELRVQVLCQSLFGSSVLFLWCWRALYGIRKSAVCLPVCSICHFGGISPVISYLPRLIFLFFHHWKSGFKVV